MMQHYKFELKNRNKKNTHANATKWTDFLIKVNLLIFSMWKLTLGYDSVGYSQNLTIFHHHLVFIKKKSKAKKTHGGVAVLFFVPKFHTTTTKEKRSKEYFVANAF